MFIDGFEQWSKLNKNFSLPLDEFSKETASLYRRIAQKNLEWVSENLSRTSDQLARLSNTKKPEEFLNVQKECLNENMKATIENIQKITQLIMENIQEFTKLWASCREPINHAAKVMTKVAEKSVERTKEKA